MTTLLFVNFYKTFNSIHSGKMEQIPLAYGLPNETVTAIMMLNKNTKAMVRSPDRDTVFFDIIARVVHGDTLFIICLDYVIRTSIDLIKEKKFTLKKARAETITDEDYVDDRTLLENVLPNVIPDCITLIKQQDALAFE